MKLPALSVVGTGPIAIAVARRHHDAGGEVRAVLSRDSGRAATVVAMVGAGTPTTEAAAALDADVVLVAVRDDAVAEVGQRLLGARQPQQAPLIVHTSGLHEAAELGDPGESTLNTRRLASLHPLQSVPRPTRWNSEAAEFLAARLSGAHWFHEGEGALLLHTLVAAWDGTFHALAPGGKSLYHAAAAILSNHSVALFEVATRLFGAAGLSRDAAQAPLAALLAGTAENLGTLGSPAALTGPVARGDVETVARHLAALGAGAPELIPQYVALALVAVDVAMEKGTLDVLRADQLRELLRR